MKTPLRYLVIVTSLVVAMQKTSAQCTASDILIQNIVPAATQTPGTCTATFDLSFTMENNNGNKFIFLHAWAESAYPNFFDCTNGNPGPGTTRPVPLQADLAGTFLNIAIDNSSDQPVVLSTYTPDPGLTLTSVGSITKTILPDGSAFFVLTGVTATFPVACNTPFLMALDFWSSQAAQGQTVQCVSCHILYAINYISKGSPFAASCATLTYNAAINNVSGTTLTGYYLVYADVNGDQHLATSVDSLIKDTTQFTVAGGATLSVTGSIPAVNFNQDLILVVTLTGGVANGTSVFLIPTSLCAPLPVTFKSFTATRVNRTGVALKWETATEVNNSGFAILRNMGAGVWDAVAFIPSHAADGNSTSPLSYTFSDVNSSQGVTQYRIKQVDIDGRSKFSEIRAVRGFEQSGKIIVYPNPSSDGRVNVVFDDAEGTRDVILMDVSGRMIKQWKGITGNTIQIDNLVQGMYSLKIVNRDTGVQNIEKIVVNNR